MSSAGDLRASMWLIVHKSAESWGTISAALETDYSALKFYDPLHLFFPPLFLKASAVEHLNPVLNLTTHWVKDMRGQKKKKETEEKNAIYKERETTHGVQSRGKASRSACVYSLSLRGMARGCGSSSVRLLKMSSGSTWKWDIHQEMCVLQSSLVFFTDCTKTRNITESELGLITFYDLISSGWPTTSHKQK